MTSNGNADPVKKEATVTVDVDQFVPKFGLRGALVIFGGFVIHLTIGSFYMFGNYSPYMISYLRNRTSDSDVRNVDGIWVTSIGGVLDALGMIAGGLLDRRYGPRIATAMASFVYCSSIALTYFTVQSSLALITLTYGCGTSVGGGMGYISALQAGIRWLPHRTALASGVIVSGIGGGTLIFSPVLTAYINPDNLSPDQEVDDDDKYFTQQDLLDRVPRSFLLLGGIFLAMQMFGILCLANPTSNDYTKSTSDGNNVPRVTKEGFTNTSYDGDMESYKEIASPEKHENNSEKTPLVEKQATGKQPALSVLKEALSVRSTYVLCVTAVCMVFAIAFLSSVSKAYGQNFISDDQFLALSLAISSVFNCVGRPFWGLINDRLGYRISMWTITAGFAIIVGTFRYTEDMGRAGFMTWLCLIFFLYAGLWSVAPATCARMFGTDNTGIVMGLLGASIGVASLTVGVTSVTLKDDLGWHGLFYLCSGIIAIAFVLTFFFNGRNRQGQKI